MFRDQHDLPQMISVVLDDAVDVRIMRQAVRRINAG